MELVSIFIIAFLLWSLLTLGSAFIRSPFSFIFMIIGLGFLFGDDDCDL